MDPIQAIIDQAKYLVAVAFLLGLAMVGMVGIVYLLAHWWKFKDREKKSLEFVVLQVAVPRDNEIKIDAAEQMFSSIFSIKKGGGMLKSLKPQEHISFEIVGTKEDIRFYMDVPHKLRDLLEKQIPGAYPEKAKYNVDPKTYEQIENKCSKPGFATSIRMVVSANTKETADALLSNLVSAFSQFNSEHNSLTKAKLRFKRFFMIDFIYRYQPIFGNKNILSTEELATLYHLPNKSVETPHIFWVRAKRAPAPAQVPKEGLYLGKSSYRGVTRPVYIGDDDRMRHIYIIGKTGVGKSELLTDMILQDIK